MRIPARCLSGSLLLVTAFTAGPAVARVRPARSTVRSVDAVAAEAPPPSSAVVPPAAAVVAPDVRPGITFVENLGQTRADAPFYARGNDRTVWLTPRAIRIELRRREASPAPPTGRGARAAFGAERAPVSGRVRRADVVETLVGGSPRVRLDAGAEQPGRQNFLLGDDPTRWRTGARTYRLVTYRNAWEGVDLRLYGDGSDLEQEYVVRPGARPARIRMRLDAGRVAVARDGSLVVRTALGALRERPPVAYQHVGGRRVEVPVRFALLGRDQYGFAVGAYDRSAPLVIDPVMRFATFMGGIHDDVANAVATDPAGNSYVVGFTASEDFPVAGSPYQNKRKNIGFYIYNVFLAKLSPSGVPLYSSFLGGDGTGAFQSGDKGNAIALDDLGDIYIAGQTDSSNFPITTATAYQTSKAASTDAFFTKLNPDGTQLLYSTYLGGAGADAALGLAVDAGRRAYVVGNAPGAGFPTKSAFQTTPNGTDNGFVTKLDPTASGPASLVYSTYLGGNGNFGGLFAIAVDATGHAYVTGQTQASDYPTTTGVLKEHMTLNASCSVSNPPRSAAVVAKLLPDGSDRVWATYLTGTMENQVGGVGCDQFGHAIAVDAMGQVYVQGATNTTDFPTSSNAVQKTFGCCQFQNFVMKLKPDATGFLYSTLLTAGNERSFPGSQLVLDAAGNVTVTGVTFGSQWHTTSDALQAASGGGLDAFVTKLNADASDFLYSSYLGGNGDDAGNGLAVDADGNTHVVGGSNSTANFPWTTGAFQHAFSGGDRSDAFMASFGSPLASSVKPSHAGNAGGITVTIGGSGFRDGATVRLTGAQTITARTAKVSPDGASVKAVFDLTHVPPGVYAPSVVNPDSTTFTSPETFTVEAGGGPSLWVDVVGRPAIRVNTPSTFFLTYGNSGNQDAYFVRLFMSVPTASMLIAPGFTPASPGTGGAAGAMTSASRDRTVLSLVVPVVPAGSTAALPITLTAPALGKGIPIAAWVNPAAFMSLTALDTLRGARTQAVAPDGARPEPAATLSLGVMTLGDCYERMIAYAVAALGFNLPQTCLGLFTVGFKEQVDAMVTEAIGANAPPEVFSAALGQVLYAIVQSQVVPCVQQTLGLVAPVAAQKIVDGLIDSLVQLVNNTILNQDCQVIVTIEEDGDEDDGGDDDTDDGDTDGGGNGTDSDGAIDPNDKAGPMGGGGAAHWVPPTTPLSYLVEFENQATATAPAQQVVVRDQLDPAKVDLATFALGPIFFGSHSVAPPAGVTAFATTVDLRPAQDLLVGIAAKLDGATGLVTWRLSSLDPVTGLPPADPTVGFLPPDTNPPAGTGGMLFTVRAVGALASGTTVSNQASIVFDANAPIVTPVWTNTIDKSVPASRVTALGASQTVTRFRVDWSGTTPNGPGVQDYTILAGVDGGPLTPWLTNTTATSGMFVGKPGHSYAFASRARSLGGAREAMHASADTTTAVSAKALAGVLKASPRKLAFGSGPVGKAVRKSRVLTLRNKGKRKKGVPVGLGIVRTAGDFYVVKNECPATLDVGKHCRITVGFVPTAAGRRSGAVDVDNDTAESPLAVKASGKGKAAKKGK